METRKFDLVVQQAAETLDKLKFEKDNETVTDDSLELHYTSENGGIRIVYSAGKLSCFDDGEKRLVYALLPEDASDKDVRFVSGELVETLNEKFGEKAPRARKSSSKMPDTVSKAAVKAGSSYNESSLASKICLVFPELREVYKANVDSYGEFLPQEFFSEYATPKIIGAIKENKPSTMKKLFQILNEMYEDGTNDLQSLIAVTILGELDNDQILLARCVDYMSETMAPPVIEVNKYLAGPKGKKAKEKMKDPPPYKPKKVKRPGLMQRLMGGQQNPTLNNR